MKRACASFEFGKSPYPRWFLSLTYAGVVQVSYRAPEYDLTAFFHGTKLAAKVGDIIKLWDGGEVTVSPPTECNVQCDVAAYVPSPNSPNLAQSSVAPESPVLYSNKHNEFVSVSTAQADILRDIVKERSHQEEKWGTEFDDRNTPNDWTTYIVQQLAKATPYPIGEKVFYDQMVKVAALAVAACETMKRNKGQLPPRHYDPRNSKKEAV